MAQKTLDPQHYDTALRDRLGMLVDRFSQAEVARRTNTPRGKVHRYLHGVRVPGDFLSALIDGLGVNPSWLLTGEGVPFLEDVTPLNQNIAGDLLGLVQSLNNVSRLKLGSLLGKDNLRDLHALNIQLREYRGLTEALDKTTQPLFVELIDATQSAIAKKELEKALANERALLHIAELCKDANCHLQLLQCRLWLENWRGNVAAALDLARRVYFSVASDKASSSRDLCLAAANYGTLLRKQGIVHEAVRLFRSTLELAAPDNDHYWLLHVHLASAVENVGEIREALALAQEAVTHFQSQRLRQYAESVLGGFLLWSGTFSIKQMKFISKADDNWAIPVSYAALWNQDTDALLLASKIVASNAMMAASPQFRILRDWVLIAEAAHRKKPTKKLLNSFTEKHPEDLRGLQSELAYFEYEVALSSLAYISGDMAEAKKMTLAAQDRLPQMLPDCRPPTMLLALHYRNILTLASEKRAAVKIRHARPQAQAFFEDAREKGYAIFNNLNDQ